MKRFIHLLVALIFAVGAAGCATTAPKGESVKVKCPACGYEFEAPMAHE